MEGKESRINNNTDFVNDRISALPDFILGHILSFLPTEEAVATAFLSKRWKFVWVIVHNLEFYNCREQTEDENMKFARFVNRALLLHDAGWLNKFSLVWHPWPISSHVTSWINSAITKKVREVSVHLDEEFDDMPTSIFNCDSLQYLELTGTTFVYDATMVCLPRLESLKLNRVYFESEEACEKLVSGCLMLHYLKLYISFRDDSDDEDDDFTCIISSSSLRHLNIDFQYKSSLKLKASSLEFLEVSGGISEICVEKNLSSLVQAVFNIRVDEDDFPNNSIVEAVRAFNCAKVLTLSTDAMWALSRATISLSTEFKRLVKLEARTYFSSLQDFIQSSNNLEVLIVDQFIRNMRHHSKWTTPLEVPRCLSNSLKNVQFYDYNGLEDEREMIRYMLKYGSALEVMRISCYRKGDGEKLKLLQEICEFPRKSPVCKVQFSP